jgi:mono/diheme cytochrome c family protein
MKAIVHALAAVLAALLAAFAAGCESPIEDDLIEAQGPEVAGLEEGAFHRYGQQCFACHGGYGPGPEMAFAGTLFATPDDDIPVQAATITITDATGDTRATVSNCAGNFYVLKESWDPVYPLRAEIECILPTDDPDAVPERRRNVMATRINRDGGCNSCHQKGPANADSVGQLYCMPEQPDIEFRRVPGCQGGPQY